MDVSVIICTHNPREDYLRRVLDSLKAQTLSQEEWEFLLVDNASKQPLAEIGNLPWHPHARTIREDELGLTPARLRGIREATADLMVFSDDDTLFDPTYFAEALRISKEWPMLGAWGGQPTPEFESLPPDWTRPYQAMLGLCRTERDCWSNNYDGKACPIGAGLCIRRSVANRYAANLQDGKRFGLGRTGQELLSGEDTDMVMSACDMSLGVGRFMSLKFVHLIPDRRLTLAYLLALREGMVFSHIILDSYRPKIFPRKPLLREVAGYLWRIVRGNSYERRFQLAAWRGERKARRLLAKSNRTTK